MFCVRRGDGHTFQKALGPAAFMHLCDLHLLAVFVQTPADRKVIGLGGQELTVSSDQP